MTTHPKITSISPEERAKTLPICRAVCSKCSEWVHPANGCACSQSDRKDDDALAEQEVADAIATAELEAFRAGQESMRERAADLFVAGCDEILDLPILDAPTDHATDPGAGGEETVIDPNTIPCWHCMKPVRLEESVFGFSVNCRCGMRGPHQPSGELARAGYLQLVETIDAAREARDALVLAMRGARVRLEEKNQPAGEGKG